MKQITTRMQNEAVRLEEVFNKKHPNSKMFEIGDIVLVRVPRSYMYSDTYLWGRKARITDVKQSNEGELLHRYRIYWLETGGIKPSEKPNSDCEYWIHGRDLKQYFLGSDFMIEPARWHDTDSGQILLITQRKTLSRCQRR